MPLRGTIKIRSNHHEHTNLFSNTRSRDRMQAQATQTELETQEIETDQPESQPLAKGDPVLTRRDISILKWLGEQTIASLPNLQALLGRVSIPPEKLKYKKVAVELSESNTRRIVARWKRLGLIQSARRYIDTPTLYWLTAAAIRELELPFRDRVWRADHIKHYLQVNRVRLWAESVPERLKLRVWESERQLYTQVVETDKTHRPDAVITANIPADPDTAAPFRVAVEVELTNKKADALRRNMGLLSSDESLAAIWYFVNSETRRKVGEAAQEFPKVRLYDLTTFTSLSITKSD